MIKFPKKRARIVRDNFNGFEVQVKLWWWPFWFQGKTNTHTTLEKAEQYALVRLQPCIKEVFLVEEKESHEQR